MSRFLDIHQAAERDLEEAGEYIRRNSPQSALRFLRAARATMERLLSMPETGGLYESDVLDLTGVRVFPVSRFRNYLIFYRPTENGLEVLRVLHGPRDIDRILGMDRGGEEEQSEQDSGGGERQD